MNARTMTAASVAKPIGVMKIALRSCANVIRGITPELSAVTDAGSGGEYACHDVLRKQQV